MKTLDRGNHIVSVVTSCPLLTCLTCDGLSGLDGTSRPDQPSTIVRYYSYAPLQSTQLCMARIRHIGHRRASPVCAFDGRRRQWEGSAGMLRPLSTTGGDGLNQCTGAEIEEEAAKISSL